MIAPLAHRGPDDDGIWLDAEAGVGLGFRRLAILDLTPAGHQPMVSRSGRYVIAFNGEIYNFNDLRHELEAGGATFRGHSDTEVILAAAERWGVAEAVRRLWGMFAIAIWDRNLRELALARDRLGEKPLYYGRAGTSWVFGSELKALRQHPAFEDRIDRSALASYLRFGYVPGPWSIYDGVGKLPPGSLAVLRAGSAPQTGRYWDARAVAAGERRPLVGEEAEREAVDELDALLRDAVARRMVADVPLGAFLSGGVDSSTVVALMRQQASGAVRTFSIGFDVPGYDEARAARQVAAHLGTDHTELYVTPGDAQAVIPKLPAIYDEPFADSSQVPTYLVSQLARRHVSVALSGDGGDELFAGYTRYLWAESIWRGIGPLPRPVRRAAATSLSAVPPASLDAVVGRLQRLAPRSWRVSHLGDKVHKVAAVLSVQTRDELYKRLVSSWKNPDSVVPGGQEYESVLGAPTLAEDFPDFTERMMYLDLVTYLPDDILVKVDRASMAVSLEARVPLLDHRVVEFAWRLPLSLKRRAGQTKWLLRQVLYRYVPPGLIERPKMGFGIPIDVWLRGPLRQWAEDLLDEARLRREGFFDASTVRAVWRAHLSGHSREQSRLWAVLMFQSWLEESRVARLPAAAGAAR